MKNANEFFFGLTFGPLVGFIISSILYRLPLLLNIFGVSVFIPVIKISLSYFMVQLISTVIIISWLEKNLN